MKRLVSRLGNQLSPSRHSRALEIITWTMGANALAGFGQQLNHIVAEAITDCLGAQILQSTLLTRMSSDGFNTGSLLTEFGAGLIGSALLAICPIIVCLRRRPQRKFRICVEQR